MIKSEVSIIENILSEGNAISVVHDSGVVLNRSTNVRKVVGAISVSGDVTVRVYPDTHQGTKRLGTLFYENSQLVQAANNPQINALVAR